MASLKPLPKVRTDLIKIRQVQRGVTLYIYKVPVKNLYYQIDEIQHEILELLDGTCTATELVDEFNTRDLVLPIDEDFLDTYVSSMKDMDIFEKTDEERRRIVLERIRDKRRKRITNSNIRGNIFELTFPGWNPTGFFDWVLPKVKFFWTPGFVIFSAACILIMLGIWVARWQEVQEGTLALYTFKGKTAGDFLDFFLILLVIGFLHESAHGLTCRYYGGVVTQMGFVLMFFTPCFFVDVSDSYLFDKSYKRQWVIHAGIYFELFLCALATFVWALTSPGSAVYEIAYKTLLVTGISSLVVQLNPLIKLDGYFSLMVYLEISDLWEKSFEFFNNWIKKNIFRLPVEYDPPPKRVRKIMVTYCLFSIAYKILLSAVFLFFLRNAFRSMFGPIGYLVLAGLVFLVFRKSLMKLGKFIRFFFLDKREVLMKPRSLVGLGATAVLLVGLVAVPRMPIGISGNFLVEPNRTAMVRATEAGVLERILVREGQRVTAGESLAILRNEDLEQKLATARWDLQAVRGEIAWARQRGEGSAVVRNLGRRDRIDREIAILMQRLEDLRLLAPADGVVVTPRLEDRVGSYLDVGEAFCEIIGIDGFHARMPIREARLDRVRPGQEVDLIFIAYPFRSFRGRVAALAPVSRGGEGVEGEESGIPEFTEFDVIVEIEDPAERIKSGMGGKARIRVGRATIAGRVGRAFQRWVGSRVW